MLSGNIALVTGASRGIGRAIAFCLAKEGATVIVNYASSKELAEQVVQEIKKNGGKAITYQCDVSDFTACEKMIKDLVNRYKRIDVIVNNAGVTKDQLLARMSEHEFDKVINTNLKGTFHTIKHASRYFMKQKKGKIINITSVSGILGNIGQANYAASKAGIIGLTKSAARELASRNINVNAIAPGFVKTDMTEKITQEMKQSILEKIPLKREGKPEDIAEMTVFLASSKSDYITGQVFCVDGGMAI